MLWRQMAPATEIVDSRRSRMARKTFVGSGSENAGNSESVRLLRDNSLSRVFSAFSSPDSPVHLTLNRPLAFAA